MFTDYIESVGSTIYLSTNDTFSLTYFSSDDDISIMIILFKN